jgi:hypothetical protein
MLHLLFALAAALIGIGTVIATLSLDSIVDWARQRWTPGPILIIDPSISSELERAAANACTKRYRRLLLHRGTQERQFIESDSIARELEHNPIIELDLG